MTKTNPHDVVTMTPEPNRGHLFPVLERVTRAVDAVRSQLATATEALFVARFEAIDRQSCLIEAERQRDIHAGDLALLAEQMRAWADDLNTGRLDLDGVIEALRSVAHDVEAGLEESR